MIIIGEGEGDCSPAPPTPLSLRDCKCILKTLNVSLSDICSFNITFLLGPVEEPNCKIRIVCVWYHHFCKGIPRYNFGERFPAWRHYSRQLLYTGRWGVPDKIQHTTNTNRQQAGDRAHPQLCRLVGLINWGHDTTSGHGRQDQLTRRGS